MLTPRVAAIHDLSGFGRCSLTVAIPGPFGHGPSVLSAANGFFIHPYRRL